MNKIFFNSNVILQYISVSIQMMKNYVVEISFNSLSLSLNSSDVIWITRGNN